MFVMQPRPKTDLVYCLRVLEAIGKINLYTAGYIDKFIVFVTITEHIPVFKSALEHLIQTELKQEKFNQMEYDMSKQSNFYRHIDFTNID